MMIIRLAYDQTMLSLFFCFLTFFITIFYSYIENGVLKIKPTLVKDEMSDYEMRNGYQNLKGCNLEPCTM